MNTRDRERIAEQLIENWDGTNAKVTLRQSSTYTLAHALHAYRLADTIPLVRQALGITPHAGIITITKTHDKYSVTTYRAHKTIRHAKLTGEAVLDRNLQNIYWQRATTALELR